MKILLKTSWLWVLEILCPLLKFLEMMKCVVGQVFLHHKHPLLPLKIQFLMMSPLSKNKNKTLHNPMLLLNQVEIAVDPRDRLDLICFGENDEIDDGSALDDEPNVAQE